MPQLISQNDRPTPALAFDTSYLMCDFLQIRLAAKPEFTDSRRGLHGDMRVFKNFPEILMGLGETMLAEYHYPHPDSEPELVGEIRHKYESVSDLDDPKLGGFSYRLLDGGSLSDACLQICCSPNQYFQIHNLFGSSSFGECAAAMLSELRRLKPQVEKYFDFSSAYILRIDATLNFLLDTTALCETVFDKIGGISVGQIRASAPEENTHYWNKGSTKSRLAVYKKGPLFKKILRQLDRELRRNPNDPALIERHRVFSNPDFIEYADRCLRLESRKKAPWFKNQRFDIGLKNEIGSSFLPDSPRANGHLCPLTVIEFIEFEKKFNAHNPHNLCFEIWKRSFSELLAAFEAKDMSILDPDDTAAVYARIRSVHAKITKTGKTSYAKANNVISFFNNLRLLGWNAHCDSLRVPNNETGGTKLPSSFYAMRDALEDCGFSLADLQQIQPALDRANPDVTPLRQIIRLELCAPARDCPENYEIFRFTGTDNFVADMKMLRVQNQPKFENPLETHAEQLMHDTRGIRWLHDEIDRDNCGYGVFDVDFDSVRSHDAYAVVIPQKIKFDSEEAAHLDCYSAGKNIFTWPVKTQQIRYDRISR